MVAFLNHGNSANGTSSSSLPRSSQNPCLNTWVTSTSEVTVPGIFNLRDVGFDHGLRFPQLARRHARLTGQRHFWRQPELRFAVRMRDMDMNPFLLARKEERYPGGCRLKGLGVILLVTANANFPVASSCSSVLAAYLTLSHSGATLGTKISIRCGELASTGFQSIRNSASPRFDAGPANATLSVASASKITRRL